MARRGENIYKRKDGRWEGRFIKARSDAGMRFGYVYGHTYGETRAKLSAARNEWAIRGWEEKQRRATLRSVGGAWLQDCEGRLRPSTVTRYRTYLESRILPRFGECNMDTITDDQIADFCRNLLKEGNASGEGLAPRTVAAILLVLKQLRKFALKRGIRVGFSEECAFVNQSQTPVRVFSLPEQERLADFLRNHLNREHLALLLCLFTGIRLGEACALRGEDISLPAMEMRIDRTVQRLPVNGAQTRTGLVLTPPKSFASARIIPLTDELCRLLAGFLDEGTYLLTGNRYAPMDPRRLQRCFKKALAACRIPDARFHTLRHSFATRCIESGMDVKTLSEILGHSRVTMTLERYVHPSMQAKREGISRSALTRSPATSAISLQSRQINRQAPEPSALETTHDNRDNPGAFQ